MFNPSAALVYYSSISLYMDTSQTMPLKPLPRSTSSITRFGENYFVAGGITVQRPLEVFCIICGIRIFICPLTTPLYILAKSVGA